MSKRYIINFYVGGIVTSKGSVLPRGGEGHLHTHKYTHTHTNSHTCFDHTCERILHTHTTHTNICTYIQLRQIITRSKIRSIDEIRKAVATIDKVHIDKKVSHRQNFVPNGASYILAPPYPCARGHMSPPEIITELKSAGLYQLTVMLKT